MKTAKNTLSLLCFVFYLSAVSSGQAGKLEEEDSLLNIKNKAKAFTPES